MRHALPAARVHFSELIAPAKNERVRVLLNYLLQLRRVKPQFAPVILAEERRQNGGDVARPVLLQKQSRKKCGVVIECVSHVGAEYQSVHAGPPAMSETSDEKGLLNFRRAQRRVRLRWVVKLTHIAAL